MPIDTMSKINDAFNPGSPRPDDIRSVGWMVAAHNDYRQNGLLKTFWLFSKGERCVKGEGVTDTMALDEIRLKLS